MSLISSKQIPPSERLIVALDVPSHEVARSLVDNLGDEVVFYKLGLELFLAGDYTKLVDTLVSQGKKVFVDLKFFDVPETVKRAVAQLQDVGATFATVHGNDTMLAAAIEARHETKILAVTVLTSLDQSDTKDLGFGDISVEDLVLHRARKALALGCDGVISSGQEASRLRAELGENFLIVAPGIRPVANVDDQKRTVDVEEAFLNGADYIVVGRQIRDAADRLDAASDIQRRIKSVFEATPLTLA